MEWPLASIAIAKKLAALWRFASIVAPPGNSIWKRAEVMLSGIS